MSDDCACRDNPDACPAFQALLRVSGSNHFDLVQCPETLYDVFNMLVNRMGYLFLYVSLTMHGQFTPAVASLVRVVHETTR